MHQFSMSMVTIQKVVHSTIVNDCLPDNYTNFPTDVSRALDTAFQYRNAFRKVKRRANRDAYESDYGI